MLSLYGDVTIYKNVSTATDLIQFCDDCATVTSEYYDYLDTSTMCILNSVAIT